MKKKKHIQVKPSITHKALQFQEFIPKDLIPSVTVCMVLLNAWCLSLQVVRSKEGIIYLEFIHQDIRSRGNLSLAQFAAYKYRVRVKVCKLHCGVHCSVVQHWTQDGRAMSLIPCTRDVHQPFLEALYLVHIVSHHLEALSIHHSVSSLKFRSSFASTKFASLGAISPPKCFIEMVPWCTD